MNIKGSIRIKNIIQVTISNIITIVSGVLCALLLPKMISVEDYGWVKTFTLYATYAGFCSLGIIDGIVLKFGGFDYDQFDRNVFRGYFKSYVFVNSLFASIILVFSIFFFDSNYRYVFIILSIYIVVVNISGYFQQISQITQRFKEYSLRKIIISGLKVVVIGLLFVCNFFGITPNYRIYITCLLISELILMIWYLNTYKDIIFGKGTTIIESKHDVLDLIKTGFPLLFANICSTLILSIDRQFVSVLFDTESYAIYAFAYNMLSLVTVALSAVATVLYPALKRTTRDSMKQNYSTLIGIITIMVFAGISLYFPLCIFIEWFLPKYVDSLVIFRIVFPGLALSSAITVVMHNYYKALGKNLIFFRKSIVILVFSGLANLVAYYIFKTTTSISVASIVTMLVWYLYIEQFFVKEYKYSRKKNLSYLLIMIFAFYLLSGIFNYYLGFICYFLFFVLISYVIYRKDITNMKQMIKK